MTHSHTSSEIQKGLWLVSPHMASRYLHNASKIVEGNTTLINGKELEANSIREVIDPSGRVVNTREEETPAGSIGIVRCIGSMYKYGGWFNWGSDELVAMMQDFENNPNIIGQIHHDDSGGGTVSSVGPYKDFHQNRKKPVVSLLDTSASANYWKNAQSDFLMAENDISAMFGSIGVMLSFYDYTKMLTEMGIVEHIIEADESEDKNKAFKLALEGKYELIKKELLSPLAIKFQDHVKAARPGLKLNTPGILSGKMFYAEEAQEIGLIDGIGNMDAAIEKVKFLASARSFISSNY
ncbi:S49 family peptidase [Lacinutrix sp. Hel_I_90]|uniref:S49 family peptidase n=1 Tax=Lacinutrix sp. Hel_I_90 TaxID=1249999 RepID=UPI0006978932|nr:S49 family peptidase [Lacinutrix sp. Hel_I_90]